MKIVVYTSIFGGFDKLKPPLESSSNVNYVNVTDELVSTTPVWKNKVYDAIPANLSDRRKSRWAKLHPHILFPDCAVTIWHGGNIQLNINPWDAIKRWLRDYDWVLFKHPHRDCAYAEANTCRMLGKGNPATITSQMVSYRDAGFPQHYGLAACWFMIRRNNRLVKRFNELWWNELDKWSERDQLSFDYVRWHMGIVGDVPNIGYVPGDLLNHPSFVYTVH